MKTIDIMGKGWFDKVNGNSYFSCRVIVDYGMPEQKVYYIPYEYGYGEQYLYAGFTELARLGLIPLDWVTSPVYKAQKAGIILRYGIQKANKVDVIAWGKL